MAVEPWSMRLPPDDGDGRPSRPKVQAVLRRTFRWMPEREHAHTFTTYRLAYCEDPFGNDIEIYSHSSERIFSNQTE